ncbi:protein of unknown function [Hyphomicrobium sp. 1Nfss2.1]
MNVGAIRAPQWMSEILPVIWAGTA